MADETAAPEVPVGLPVVIVDIGIDVNNLQVMTTFWESLVGFETVRSAHNYSYMVNPSNVGPHLFLQLVPEVRTEKNRLHLDIVVPSLPEAVRRAESLGQGLLVRQDRRRCRLRHRGRRIGLSRCQWQCR